MTQGGVQKAGLRVVHAVAARVLLRGGIDQHLLQFLDRARVQQREFPVAQPGMALAGTQQALDFSRRKTFATRSVVSHIQVKPLFARGRDLKARLDPFQILRAPLQTLFQSDGPILLQTRIMTRENSARRPGP